jgi:hypothetical protein
MKQKIFLNQMLRNSNTAIEIDACLIFAVTYILNQGGAEFHNLFALLALGLFPI